MFLLVLLNEFFLFCDTVFSSDEEEDHHDDSKYEENDAPDNDIFVEIFGSGPEEEADHEAESSSDDADNEDGIFDDLFGGERVVIFRNALKGRFIRSHDLLVLVLFAESQLRVRSLIVFPDHFFNVVDCL